MPQQLDGAKGDLTLSGTVCLAMALTILEVRRSGLGTGLGSACSPAAMAWNFLYLSRQATRLAWDTTSSSPDCREAAWSLDSCKHQAEGIGGDGQEVFLVAAIRGLDVGHELLYHSLHGGGIPALHCCPPSLEVAPLVVLGKARKASIVEMSLGLARQGTYPCRGRS